MLFDPARHEALAGEPWDAGRVRAAIAHIVAETEARFDAAKGWPVHPNDSSPEDDPLHIGPSLYYGQCGVIWALQRLQALGAAEVSKDWRGHADRLVARTRAWLGDAAETERASYLMGETPIEMLRAADGAADDERLAALLAGNVDHPSRELMWGAAGTLLAAALLHRRDGGARWAELARRSAAALRASLEPFDAAGCLIATQDLYGRHTTYLGLGHGFFSVAAGVLRAAPCLDAAARQDWAAQIALTLRRTATWQCEGDTWMANWRPWARPPSPRLPLMQGCHGAPGVLAALRGFPGAEVDDLLLAGGEAIWGAGPLSKGANLCHGTAGNGHAFLVLFERTGDERWLARARAFAMHAIAQSRADEAAHGQLRHSLWTGDLGLALYLWNCLQAEADFPTLDSFF